LLDFGDSPLADNVEGPGGLDRIAEEFDTGGVRFGRREHVQDAAAARELARRFNHIFSGIAYFGQAFR
jgi:hypothetical protein